MKADLKKKLLDFPGFEFFCKTLTRRHVRSLMYHRFSAQHVPSNRYVDPEILTIQMQYIRDNHTVIEPDQHLEAHSGQHPGPCPVAVTVDDGYADFYDVAYPVFRKIGIPAMLFVATGFVSGKSWFWWDKLDFLISGAPEGQYEIVSNLKPIPIDLTTDERRAESWNRIADRCRFMKDEIKETFLSDLAHTLGLELPATPPAEFGPVSWDMIREMENNGIKYGAHTVNHPILSRVPLQIALSEILDSKTHLEGELDHPLTWFAYPQGGPADFNDDIKKMVLEHFSACYVAYQDMDNRGDRSHMPRYCITDDMTNFRWVLCGAEFLGLKARKLLGLRTGATDTYWAGSEEEEMQNG